MKIENVEVFGFKAALRGMRNPMESWERSDTAYGRALPYYIFDIIQGISFSESVWIGPNDIKLACSLVRAGGSHRKFLRQIIVWCDLTISRMIWTEVDTYKVATTRNSCSTMHKLGHRDLELSDFEDEEIEWSQLTLLNDLAQKYRVSNSTDDLRRLKQSLPESFLQKSTFTFSYETGLKMYCDRRNHRMREWSGPEGICEWIKSLPYMTNFIGALKGDS